MRYVGKRLRREEKRKCGLNMLLSACLMLFVCVVCLSGLTWAWFSATQSATIAPVQSAQYTVTTVVVDADQQPVDLMALKANTTYTVTLTADGTASTGWCKVMWGDETHYVQLAKDKGVTFTVIPTTDTALTVEYSWGALPQDKTVDIIQDKQFGEIISDTANTDTPAEGDEAENGTESIIPAEGDVSEPPDETPSDTDEVPAEDSSVEPSPDESTPVEDDAEEDAPTEDTPQDDMTVDDTATVSETLDI